MQIALLRSGVIAAATLFAASSAVPQPPNDPIADLIETREQPPAAKSPLAKLGGAFATYVEALHRKSCPAGVQAEQPRAISLAAKPVSLQAINPGRKTVGALTFAGGFHLTSDDPDFGGLSGLDLLDDGRLLAVSDAGHFVWIDLDADGVAPIAAHISEIRDSNGKPFATKSAVDAEGLALYDGLALISFEGNARVMAYDITGCGGAARAASLGWNLASDFKANGLSVKPNLGVEGLAITDDGFLIAGLETQVGGEGPFSIRPLEVSPQFDFRLGRKSPELVGLDQVAQGEDVRLFSLHRSAKALSSNAITFMETVLTRNANADGERAGQTFSIKSSLILAEMNILLTIDNYEGLAARQMPDGRVRLYVMSDDNFSGSQRTLLMIFDVR